MEHYSVISLGEILREEYDQQVIKEAFKKFSCERERDLENFLVQKAIPYEETGIGKTYLFIDPGELDHGRFVVLAYFTIAQRAIDISQIPPKRRRKMLGNYPGRDTLKAFPAFLIGQLGRDDKCPSSILSGHQILKECYHTISMAAKIVGGNLIVLECREHMFGKFYEREEFKKLYDEVNDEKLYTLYKKVDFESYWSK